jgi:hypothetical protein
MSVHYFIALLLQYNYAVNITIVTLEVESEMCLTY